MTEGLVDLIPADIARTPTQAPTPKEIASVNGSRLIRIALVAALVALAVYLWFRPQEKTFPLPANQALRVRERVAVLIAKDQRTQAREELAALVAGTDSASEDLVRAAAIEVSDTRDAEAEAFLARAEKRDPQSAAVAFLRGQMARQAGDSEAASKYLMRAHELAPNDLPTKILLGAIEDDLEKPAEAEKLFREVVAVGFENGQQWYFAAVTRLANLLTQSGRDADAEPFRAVIRDLEKRGVKAPTTLQFLLGELGRVKPPQPMGSVVEKGDLLKFRGQALSPRDFDGFDSFVACDRRIVAFGAKGVLAVSASPSFDDVTALTLAPTTSVVPFDADNDGDLDLLVQMNAQCTLFENTDGVFVSVAATLPALPSTAHDIAAVDWDHEGDLDFVVAGDFGARIWRRDGTNELSGEGKRVVFTDATQGSGLPEAKVFSWLVTEDFDGDNDVDFLFGGAGQPYLADSQRGGKFKEIAGAFALDLKSKPVVADFDGDARADLWIAGNPSTFVPRGGQPRASVPAAVAPRSSLSPADFDLDGSLDIAWIGVDGKVHIVLAPGLAAERALDTGFAASGVLSAFDYDDDGRTDLVFMKADGIDALHNEGPTGNGVRVSFSGLRDNQRGVGLVFEFRAGDIYRRVYWRGERIPIGVGGHTQFDVFRATWPNGANTDELDLALNAKSADGTSIFDPMKQPSAQIGSCPFLYTWNGQSYTFVSDVLGITPLGLPINADMLVPPDHDEYVLVTGEQMTLKDGAFEMQFTEELREVTYLDHAKVVVVDHPADTEVFPNERFTFPPFPKAHNHTVKQALSPLRAVDAAGAEWKEHVAAIDDVYAVPFTKQAPQFAGLAKPWFLELSFDKDVVARAKKLRLVMTGWFFWSDASANMASSRTPDVPFIPPLLHVPDGKGSWRETGPPVGFPAGKTKTMVIDVTSILSKDDPRIRVFTSLQLYWDSIRLAVDDDDAPLELREFPCTSAKLWRRGFSAPLSSGIAPGVATNDGTPERFDWNEIAPHPRWNQHPGQYTRFGECRELLDTVDDRFVIMGAGDALTLRFDARTLPPPTPGMRRDYLVYLDGWAKDRDPNSIQALEVEPLPFHAMSGYPYEADEHFPTDELHARWRAEWNTRSAWQWIRPLSPARESDWLLSVPPLR